VSLRVIIIPEAAAQIRAIDAWWSANRPAAPNLFTDELAHCLELLAQAPKIGKPYGRHPHLRGLRRALLRATRYHVYYEPRGDSVAVLAVWHSHRGQIPKL
jgi:plasmid stabilization system protein ParE